MRGVEGQGQRPGRAQRRGVEHPRHGAPPGGRQGPARQDEVLDDAGRRLQGHDRTDGRVAPDGAVRHQRRASEDHQLGHEGRAWRPGRPARAAGGAGGPGAAARRGDAAGGGDGRVAGPRHRGVGQRVPQPARDDDEVDPQQAAAGLRPGREGDPDRGAVVAAGREGPEDCADVRQHPLGHRAGRGLHARGPPRRLEGRGPRGGKRPRARGELRQAHGGSQAGQLPGSVRLPHLPLR
mmetsp:Transcript_29236/g.83571  ORF Transcript_29236/g.83571 Transcript_29236/m.83571 type:complete len:237 (+) Transcript_29236:2052-2762(+)